MRKPTKRYPEPKQVDGQWIVSLKPFGFGWHYVLAGATDERDALNLAYAKLEHLRELKAAAEGRRPAPQMELAGTVHPGWGGPPTITGAIARWQPSRLGKTPGGKHYIAKEAKGLDRELGRTPLASLCLPGGEDLLIKYRDDLMSGAFGGRRYSGRSVINRFGMLAQILRYCASKERRWLPYMPALPEMPSKAKPIYDWISEAAFRWVRDRIFVGPRRRFNGMSEAKRKKVPVDLYIARRKMYLSWLFYTGQRTGDVDAMTGDDIMWGTGNYIRRGTKTKVDIEVFEMPGPLVEDLAEYFRFVGRDFPLPGEEICGGKWAKVAHVLGGIGKDIDSPRLNPRKLRRSYARRMFELNYEIKEVAERMGHADMTMLHEIYVRTPRPGGPSRSKWPRYTGPSTAPPPPEASAPAAAAAADVRPHKVLAFPKLKATK